MPNMKKQLYGCGGVECKEQAFHTHMPIPHKGVFHPSDSLQNVKLLIVPVWKLLIPRSVALSKTGYTSLRYIVFTNS